jgi:hypothetical protein
MRKNLLHDWTLLKIDFDWRLARVTIELEDLALGRQTLIAEGVRELRVPKMNEWGPSISVNEVAEIDAPTGHGRCLDIEMQSGDVIRIVAEKIVLPPA